MRVKSLEIQGFKSFPDKTILTFEKGISAVVGPNGSGKSNISDAIRWVLGEQSSKSLRSTKSEDVIFNGTAKRKAMGYAQVTLTIDNSDRQLPFEKDDVAITRQYYRSGNSEYLINNATVRLKDINELFMDTGLGKDGYSIVSQGKIADIMDPRLSDRREIFEEAAGISKYKYRKEEALKRLDLAQENLLRIKDILHELEGRVAPLKIQSEKAEKFLALSIDKKQLEIDIWVHSLLEISKSLKEIDTKNIIVQGHVDDANEKLELLEKEIESLFLQGQRLNAIADSKRREIEQIETTVSEQEGNSKVLSNDIFHNENSIKRLKSEISLAVDSSNKYNHIIKERKEQIKNIDRQLALKNNNLQSLISKSQQVQLTKSGYSGEILELNEKIKAQTNILNDKRVEILTIKSTLLELEQKEKLLSENKNQLQCKKTELESLSLDYNNKINDYSNKKQELTNSYKGCELKYNSRVQKAQNQREIVNKLTLDIEGQNRKANILIDLEKNMEGFNNSVKTIMTASSRGILSGVEGIVSRLFKVEQEYSTAIEIALGGAMQNIVVSTQNDAKNAITYLKNNKGGRATFLPLDAIKGSVLVERGLENTYGYIGIASELVQCDSIYKQIINSLLGRVVVCEDIDCAVNIAKSYGYKFRVVTLDGQVVNSGGSMTGGSLNKNAGVLDRTNQIEKLKQEAQILTNKLQKEKQVQLNIEEELAKQKAEIVKITDQTKVVEQEFLVATTQKSATDERILRLINSIDENEMQIQNLAEVKTGKQLALISAEGTYNSVKTVLQELESQIAKVTGKQSDFLMQSEKLSNEIAIVKMDILSSQKDSDAITKSIDDILARQKDSQNEIELMNKEISELIDTNNQLLSQIQKLSENSIKLKEKSSIFKNEIEELNLKREQFEKQATQKRADERAKSQELSTVTVELARIVEQKNIVEQSYNDIIKTMWDEYELTKRQAVDLASPLKNVKEAKKQLEEYKLKIKQLGTVNLSAVQEYKEVSTRYEFLTTQVQDVEKSKDELTKLINELTSSMKEKFVQCFTQIQINFKEVFAELFGGGSGELILTDPNDVLNSAIEIKAQPIGKIITNITSLSGGEKSLTSIALYFAIMRYSPTPFCMLDEIEAALDDVNVDRFASYLRRMSTNTQFVVITHRRGTMHEADTLYGVTMQDNGISKMLTLKADEVEQKLGI